MLNFQFGFTQVEFSLTDLEIGNLLINTWWPQKESVLEQRQR